MEMNKKMRAGLLLVLFAGVFCACSGNAGKIEVEDALKSCEQKMKQTLLQLETDSCLLPRSMSSSDSVWNLVTVYDWTSGFWPGILWYGYETSGDAFIKENAVHYTACMEQLLEPQYSGDHDLGFQFLCSFVNAYRLTGEEHYKQAALDGADKLAKLYHPVVGTICSWPYMKQQKGWPHNTIIDNMMNLELLFWASKNGGNPSYYDMAEKHARVTMKNHFREDYTCYHVAVYDTVSGELIKGVTNQGAYDESFWARGQAWAIYGYTMVYRETKNKEFLNFAEYVADVYLEHLPDDYVPYWDFYAPNIPDEPKDASAAAVVASALLELSQLETDGLKSQKYFLEAERMLCSLLSDKYWAGVTSPAFLLHSTGNYPAGYEIDAAINYADYYCMEALVRYKKIKENS